MTYVALGLVAFALAFLLWRRPGLLRWVDDQTNMRGVRLARRVGIRDRLSPDEHEARRRLLRAALIAVLVVFGVGLILGGLITVGQGSGS